MSSIQSIRGFTLLETLIATGVLVTSLAGIAQLFVLGTHLTREANASGAALAAAQDKLEALRGLPFRYDADGASITDRALTVSPANSLDEDVEPYVDWIDSAGATLPSDMGAVFARRWRVSAIGGADAIAIEVCVFEPSVLQHAADACLATIRSRQP